MTDVYRSIPGGVPGDLYRRFKLIGTNPDSGDPVYAEVHALDAGSIGGGGGGVAGAVNVADGTTPTQLLAVDANGRISVNVNSAPTTAVTGTFWQNTQPVSIASMPSTPVTGTFWQATQPISVAATLSTDPVDRTARLLGHVTVDSAPSTAVTNAGTFAVQAALNAETTKVIGTVNVAAGQTIGVTGTFWQATQPVSGTFWQATQPVSIASMPSTPVTGTFWQATQPVSLASLPSLATGSNVIGHVIVDGGTAPAYIGRVSTFRTPGRAGTAGQKIFALHNATGSTVTVQIQKLTVDLVATVVKAVTVLPPVIRLWKVTVLPTNGTALTKVPADSNLSSSASVTIFGDASADGTGSGTALTATLPSGTVITEEFAPRLITAAGYEMFDRTTFLDDPNENIVLRPLEGIVLFLDYTLATQNPTTDMWLVACWWEEF